MKFTSIFKFATQSIAVLAISMLASGTFAQNIVTSDVVVKDSWVRASVPGQQATGAFMTLTAKNGVKLVSIASPAAGVAEVHEMKMEGDIMRMRAVAGGLDLPAGKAVELKPGGYHVMLMDLKTALPKNTTIALTLVFKNAKGDESKLELKVPVTTASPTGKPAMDMSQHKH
jgi:periplasmic copper chaperone A